jgi:hypothetical protein
MLVARGKPMSKAQKRGAAQKKAAAQKREAAEAFSVAVVEEVMAALRAAEEEQEYQQELWNDRIYQSPSPSPSPSNAWTSPYASEDERYASEDERERSLSYNPLTNKPMSPLLSEDWSPTPPQSPRTTLPRTPVYDELTPLFC